jgi:DNA-binding Lrp family transcriptional regulator
MAEAELSGIERAVLAHIQSDFPLVPDPYDALATRVGQSATAVHACVQELRRRDLVRRIGGSFAAGPLGYTSTLVGARVDPEALEAAAACASGFTEVTHNYEREGEYNLWFTVIAPGRQRLEEILMAVRAVPGIRALHDLPARRLFKIRVEFQFAEGQGAVTGAVDTSADAACSPLALADADRRLICRACGDLDASAAPFRALAADVGLTEADALERLSRYRRSGAMRRFGAILRHRAAGFAANGMSVWNVPEEAVARVGEALAARPEVSHCYERPRLPGWPYNVFGMIHAASRDACLAAAAAVSRDTGAADMRVLFSGREFKKTSMVYFAQGSRAPR